MKFSKQRSLRKRRPQREKLERGDKTLKKIYVDTNVFVDVEVPERQHHLESKEFMEKVLGRRDIRVCTSVYTSLEFVSAIRRQKSPRAIWRYLYNIHKKYKEGQVLWLSPTKKTIGFNPLVEELIETTIKHATPSGDTIHVLTMFQYRIKTLITWDKKDFENVKGREVLTPEEFLRTLTT